MKIILEIKAYFVFLFAFSPALLHVSPMKARSVPPPPLPPNLYTTETVTPGTKQMLQSTQRPTEGETALPFYATEKQLQELTPATLLHGGQKPQVEPPHFGLPCWAT